MSVYVDTSLVVASLTEESATQQVRSWLAEQEQASVHVSEWTLTEVSSALAMKVRTKQITPEERTVAMSVFDRMKAESLVVLPVVTAHFRAAATFSDRHELGVRAGDALHLAIAAQSGLTVVTLDQRMAEAAPALGVPAQLLA